jgi:hypothetical protein
MLFKILAYAPRINFHVIQECRPQIFHSIILPASAVYYQPFGIPIESEPRFLIVNITAVCREIPGRKQVV